MLLKSNKSIKYYLFLSISTYIWIFFIKNPGFKYQFIITPFPFLITNISKALLEGIAI